MSFDNVLCILQVKNTVNQLFSPKISMYKIIFLNDEWVKKHLKEIYLYLELDYVNTAGDGDNFLKC